MGTCFESVERMDEELARLSRSSGRLRHALGAGLEALARIGGHHDLGFSSVEAHALERCERRARWIQESRALARRLSSLPALRRALEAGDIGFSMAQLIAKAALPADEAAWLSEARSRTVRQMRKLVDERRHARGTAGGAGGNADDVAEGSDLRTLTVTVDQEDAWLFECARMIAGQVAGPTAEEAVEALLGEGTTTLLEAIGPERPGGDIDFGRCCDDPDAARQRAWEAERARWREEAEERCEKSFVGDEKRNVGAPPGTESEERGEETLFAGDSEQEDRGTIATCCERQFGGNALAIDAELRRVAEELAVRELETGRLAQAFWKADGWRRLGYATDTQYAQERLGTSLSSIKRKRALARRIAALPVLEMAIRDRELGYEAACLVASVATPETERAWVHRALERTVKHLREEVNAVQMLARLGARVRGAPPRTSSNAASMTAAAGMAVDATEVCGADCSAERGQARDASVTGATDVCGERGAAGDASVIGATDVGEAHGVAREGGAVAGRSDICAVDRAASRTPAMAAFRSPGSARTPDHEAPWPPSEEIVREVAAFESRVVSGAVFLGTGPSCLDQLSDAVTGLLDRLEGGEGLQGEAPDLVEPRFPRRPSRKDRARARVTLRLRVSTGTCSYYRWLERMFTRHGPGGVGFLRFLCASLVETWKAALGTDVAYASIYARDRYRCTSPVCSRRDVTPHHLRFRASGGDDSPSNLTSLCVQCHLGGIHAGRLRATPPAEQVTWTLGQRGYEHTVVRGRRRERALVRPLAGE